MITKNERKILKEIVEHKNLFVGGLLQDFGDDLRRFTDDLSRKVRYRMLETRIVHISLTRGFFKVDGKKFSCGFDMESGNIIYRERGWITFRGFLGHQWRIQAANKKTRKYKDYEENSIYFSSQKKKRTRRPLKGLWEPPF